MMQAVKHVCCRINKVKLAIPLLFKVQEGEMVQLITRFHYPDDFMYHCHVLGHEDNGMMGEFRVE